jgi:peptidoglycan/xylan/chitin deacetylase (PgdA/CDA1 family)
MQNFTFFCDTADPYVKYGLHHFIKKNGFVYGENPQDADIFIETKPKENISGIYISLQQHLEDIPSYLNIKGESIPIFKRPSETIDGNRLASVVCAQREYSCISVNNGHINIGFNIFSEIGRILAGHYDNYFLQKDRLGAKLRSTPVVDVLEDCLIAAINMAMSGNPVKHQCIWPEGRRFAMVLTHDVDNVRKTRQYLPSFIKSMLQADFPDLVYHIKNILLKHGKNDPYWTFETMCALENSLGVKSTCYFLQETGKVNPFNPASWVLYSGRYNVKKPDIKKQISELSGNGFEIGVHGSYNSYRSQKVLDLEKKLIESIISTDIVGIRQHYLNYDQNVTPVVHHNCGFKYDTSIGFRPAVGNGFRRGTSFPFPIMLPDLNVSPLLEIPLIIMDSAIRSTATAEECFRLIDQVEKYQGVLTVLWHTNRFNPREFPGLFKLYENIIREAKKRGAWIARASDVYKWLTEFEMNITQKVLF